MSSHSIDQSGLTKGQLRKLNALCKSVGHEIGERAFVEWLSSQSAEDGDSSAELIADTLWPLVPGRQPADPARRLQGPARGAAGLSSNRPARRAGTFPWTGFGAPRCSGALFDRSIAPPSGPPRRRTRRVASELRLHGAGAGADDRSCADADAARRRAGAGDASRPVGLLSPVKPAVSRVRRGRLRAATSFLSPIRPVSTAGATAQRVVRNRVLPQFFSSGPAYSVGSGHCVRRRNAAGVSNGPFPLNRRIDRNSSNPAGGRVIEIAPG